MYEAFAKMPVPDAPFVANFSELQKETVAGRLALELNKDRTVQFDITVKNN